MKFSLGLFFVVCTILLYSEGEAVRCEKEDIFDNSEFFSCPGPQDDASDIYCCGSKYTRYCCSDSTKNGGLFGFGSKYKQLSGEVIPKLSDSVAEKSSIVRGLAKLVGIVIGCVIFVVIVCVVCCCCCPFCLLYKKRSHGHVINQNTTQAAATGYVIPPEQSNQPQSYPLQGNVAYPPTSAVGGYPPAGPYPPPQGYPAQPPGPAYPPTSGGFAYPPPEQGYVHANPPPYPGLPDQPAQYNPQIEKDAYQTQPSYNPNY